MSVPSSANQPPIIVADTTCDLPLDLFEQYEIHLMRHRITVGEHVYLSGKDLSLDDLCKILHAGKRAQTEHPPVEDFVELYRRLGAEGRPILSIHLSQGLSATVVTARQAVAMLPDQSITVWDGETISAALGLQVLTAARAAKAGYSVERIVPLLERTKVDANFLFCLDDLSYLVRGGRVGKVSYYVAQTLGLKPIITVSKEGESVGTYVTTGERPRSLRSAIDSFLRDIELDVKRGNKIRAVSVHGDPTTVELVNELNTMIGDRYECALLASAPTTPVLAAHVGPRALGVGYIAGDWPV